MQGKGWALHPLYSQGSSGFTYTSYLPLPMAQEQPSPCELEIGFGKGEFLAYMSEQFPLVRWLGVEREGEVFFSALRRLEKTPRGNLSLYYMDALLFLKEITPPSSLTGIWLHFPDPWEKPRHKKHRLSSPERVHLLLSRLRVGGAIHLLTDSREFFEEFATSLHPFRLAPFTPFDPWQRRRFPVKTRYQEKWERLGKRFYTLELRLCAPVPSPVALEEIGFQEGSARAGEKHPGSLPPSATPDAPAGPWDSVEAGKGQGRVQIPRTPPPPPGLYERGELGLKVFPESRSTPGLHHFLFLDKKWRATVEGWVHLKEKSVLLYGVWSKERQELWEEAARGSRNLAPLFPGEGAEVGTEPV